MKNKIIAVSITLVCILIFGSCQRRPDNPNAFEMDKDSSYAIGMYLASQFHIPDVYYDYRSLMEGFRDYNEMQETRFTMDQALRILDASFERLLASNEAMMDQSMTSEENLLNLEESSLFLEENARKPGIITTNSGLQYEIIVQGSGARPTAMNDVEVHYEGTLINGYVFDSSYERDEPIVFSLNEVIRGWTEGVQLMNVGSTFIFYIHPDLAYGPYDRYDRFGNVAIPGNSALIFKVELLSIFN